MFGNVPRVQQDGGLRVRRNGDVARAFAALSLAGALLVAPLASSADRVSAGPRGFVRVLALYRLGGVPIGYLSFACRFGGRRFATAWTAQTATTGVRGFVSGRRTLTKTLQPGQSARLPLIHTRSQSWTIYSATEPETVEGSVSMEQPRAFNPCLAGRTRSSFTQTSHSVVGLYGEGRN